jgi:hypothetical protein
VLVVAPGPRRDPQLLDVAQIVPAQLPRRAAGQDSGARALYVRLLQLALWDAGLCATGTGRRAGRRRPPLVQRLVNEAAHAATGDDVAGGTAGRDRIAAIRDDVRPEFST